jgi:protein-disulfide isomerase
VRIGFKAGILSAAAMLVAAAAPTNGWTRTVAITPLGSHLIGNPAAKVKLVEYVSYTCPHCARFQTESEGVLQLAYLPSGRIAIEVRHMLRDPIDLTVALLTNCGSKDKFVLNHSAMLRSQATWTAPIAKSTPAQRQRAIAGDLKLYEAMASRGYDRTTLDRCLSDKAMAQRLVGQTKAGVDAGVNKTPSFAINGKLLDKTDTWAELRPQLDESLK